MTPQLPTSHFSTIILGSSMESGTEGFKVLFFSWWLQWAKNSVGEHGVGEIGVGEQALLDHMV